MNADEGGGGEDDYNLSVVWRTGKTGALRQGIFILAPGRGNILMHTGDGELFDRNVDTVTDKAEYRTRSVSAREVGWQTCPGGLFIGAVSQSAFRQVMANLIGRQHEVAGKRRAWEAECQPLHWLHAA